MTWTVVAFTAVVALFVLAAIGRIALAYERVHGADDPRKDSDLRRSAQEELLRKRGPQP